MGEIVLTIVSLTLIVLGVILLIDQSLYQRVLNKKLFEDYREALRMWRSELHDLSITRTYPENKQVDGPAIVDIPEIPEPPIELIDYEFRRRGQKPDEARNNIGAG